MSPVSRTPDPRPDDRADRKGPVRRYTIRFRLEPSGETVEYRAVTPMGESMAVALATARLLVWKNPDARFSDVEVTNIETDFTVDPVEDALDYWAS